MSSDVVSARHLAAIAVLVLVLCLPAGANAASDAGDWAVAGGEVVLELNRGVLDPLGIDAEFVRAASTRPARHPLGYDHGRFESLSIQQIAFRAPGGAIEAFTGGYLQVHGGIVLRLGDTKLDATDFRIEPNPQRPDEFRLLDRSGTPWARLDHGHFELVDDDTRLEIRYANLSMTPELAALVGNDAMAGQVFGVAHLSAPVVRTGDTVDTRGAEQCMNPNWPTDPGFAADVALTDMARHSGDPAVSMLRCQGCDGATGGPMVVTPNAQLLNVGTADVPWWHQFTGPFPPYGNDQHPYLVWNMYRLSADGRFEQIAASGAKHAFFSVNLNCPCIGGNILWTGCGDIYSASSNDFDDFLAPRGEIVPVSGRWGRCFSLFDPGCNGSQEGSSADPFDNRMNVFEPDLVEPGARYFVDAWYVVRDDVDIFNTMGWREVQPTWNPTTEGGIWTFPVVGDYAQGRALDAWVDPATSDRRALVETPEGTTSIAVRVTDLGNGNWRYDYAVVNHDFMRTATAGAEPDLEVVSNAGFGAFELPLAAGTSVSNTTSARADRTAGQDWQAATEATAVRWTDPGNTPLDWGTTFRFSLVTDTAPARTTIRLFPAGETTPLVTGLLGPEPAELLFASDFEPPAAR